jgi:hypothetical protein
MNHGFNALEVSNYQTLFKGADADKSGKVRYRQRKVKSDTGSTLTSVKIKQEVTYA